jgi:nitrogen fixation/metabolism regulation signal transduction histidine kinase
VAYAITSPEAKRQQALLGAHVVYFFGKSIQATSFGTAIEQQASLGKSLFEGGLAEQALTSDKGLGDIKVVEYDGSDYLATTGKLPSYSSKALPKDYPVPEAGAMVLISLSEATSSVSAAGLTILLVGFFGIILIFVAISLTARKILHPLEEIEIGVNDIINGNLDRTFEPVGSDLDGLANALNVMLARLLGRPEPGEEEFDEDGNIIRNEVQLPRIHQSGAIDLKQAEAEALAAEPFNDYLKRVHGEYVAAQQANGETNTTSYDDFVKKLQTNEGPLKQKYGAREVRFKVVTKDGKVTLKPLPIM